MAGYLALIFLQHHAHRLIECPCSVPWLRLDNSLMVILGMLLPLLDLKPISWQTVSSKGFLELEGQIGG